MTVLNLAKQTTETTGTGTISLSATATNGNKTLLAAAADDTGGAGPYSSISYTIICGNDIEIGTGTLTDTGSGTATLTRSVIASTNSNAAIVLSGTSTVKSAANTGDF